MAKLSENAIKVLNFLLDQPEGKKVFGSEVAEATFINPRSVTGTINGLVKKGLVVSEAHEDPTVTQKVYYATEAAAEVADNDFDYVKPE